MHFSWIHVVWDTKVSGATSENYIAGEAFLVGWKYWSENTALNCGEFFTRHICFRHSYNVSPTMILSFKLICNVIMSYSLLLQECKIFSEERIYSCMSPFKNLVKHIFNFCCFFSAKSNPKVAISVIISSKTSR